MTDPSHPRKKRTLASIGLIVGVLALAAAFLSPHIAEAIDPPKPPVEEMVVDLASRVIEAAKAKAAGQRYPSAAPAPPLPSRFLFPSVIAVGMIGAAFGVASLIRSEDRAMAKGAIILGVGAAFIQWSMMIVGAIMLVLLVLAVISFLTGGGI